MAQRIYADRGQIVSNEGADAIPSPPDDIPTREERERALREATLDNIGTPYNFLKVNVKQLQDVNHYRVNVYREIGGTPRICDSFYVVMTTEDVISSPPMAKKYYSDEELSDLLATSL